MVDGSQHEYLDLVCRRALIYVHQACQRIQPCHLFSPKDHQKGRQKKIMFDRVDLESYGVVPADVQSTFLNEERVEMFSFFHLTVQEHLDALYCATNLFSQNRHNPSSGLLVLQSTDLNMDKLENLQMFTRFFMGVLRARLAGQLDGLVISPREQRDSIAARLGVWFRDQIKGRKLENPAQP